MTNNISSSTKWIATAFHICINYFILIPFVLYYLVKFIKKRDEMIIFKRYPQIAIWINILVLALLLFHRPIQVILVVSPLRESKPAYFYYLGTLWNVIYFLVYSVIWLYLTRFWLMFYDLKRGNSSLNSRWKFYLDPKLDEGDFWTRNPHLGSVQWVLRITTLLWLCTALIWSVPYQISLKVDFFENGKIYTLSMVLLALCHLLCTLFCTVLWCKAPQISDIFYLRFELKILITLLWVTISWWFLLMFAQFMANQRCSDNELLLYSLRNLHSFSGSVIYALYSSVSTMFVLHKHERDAQNTKPSRNLWGVDNLKAKAPMNLWDVLLHREYFELFVQHLCREFSVESILCFIELMQFKEVIMQKFRLEPQNTDDGATVGERKDGKPSKCFHIGVEMFVLSQNSKIPKSHLIYNAINTANESNIETYLKMAYLLFCKYINDRNHSDLEINISWQMRERYMNDFNDMGLESFVDAHKDAMEATQLFAYFDVVIEELYQLLSVSFERFLRTDIKVAISRLIMENRTTVELEHIIKYQNKKIRVE